MASSPAPCSPPPAQLPRRGHQVVLANSVDSAVPSGVISGRILTASCLSFLSCKADVKDLRRPRRTSRPSMGPAAWGGGHSPAGSPSGPMSTPGRHHHLHPTAEETKAQPCPLSTREALGAPLLAAGFCPLSGALAFRCPHDCLTRTSLNGLDFKIKLQTHGLEEYNVLSTQAWMENGCPLMGS